MIVPAAMMRPTTASAKKRYRIVKDFSTKTLA